MVMATLAAKRRERALRLQKEQEERKQLAISLFPEFDSGTGSLDKAGLKGLLAKMEPDNPPSDDGVNYVHHSIFPSNPDGALGTCHMLAMIKHYRYWTLKENDVEECFTQHDTDKSGFLDREQFKKALVAIETANADKRAYDAGDWTKTIIELTEELFEKITEISDWNADGKIYKPEALAAMTLWSAMAKEEAKKKKSGACLIA